MPFTWDVLSKILAECQSIFTKKFGSSLDFKIILPKISAEVFLLNF